MSVYISLLRGINVSGKKKKKMDALVNLYEQLGYENITTYVQSGNVVFCTSQKNAKKIESKIYDKIKSSFEFDVPTLVYTTEEFQELVDGNPFLKDETKSSEQLYYTFLSTPPETADLAKFEALLLDNEEFYYTNRVVYLYFPEGYSKTKLNNNKIESILNVASTTRNANTTSALLKMASLK